MSLQATVADPFRRSGRETLDRSEFVVGLSLDRDWFEPDEAERIAAVAVERDLLRETDDGLHPTFEVGTVDPLDETPTLTVPDADASPFEVVVDRLVATGADRRDTVAAINARQERLGVDAPTAAVLHAHGQGVDVGDLIDQLRETRSAPSARD